MDIEGRPRVDVITAPAEGLWGRIAEEARSFYRRLAFDHIGSVTTGGGQELLILARRS